MMRRGIFAILLFFLIYCAAATAGTVAITFDDLPVTGLQISARQAGSMNAAFLAAFKRHNWVVTGFVNEGRLDDSDRAQRVRFLTEWIDAGMDLGNHTYSHKSFNDVDINAYEGDVLRGEQITRRLLARRGRSVRWYRPPYLATGVNAAKRRNFETWLAHHGYRLAPVSMQTADWMFAWPYEHAIADRKHSLAARIRASYIAYVARIIPWYRHAAHDVLGREPAFILLLHANRLNATCLDELAQILTDNELQPITLDTAMRDPAYRIRDRYIAPQGADWVTRWAFALHKNLHLTPPPSIPSDIIVIETRLEAPRRLR